MIPVFRAVLKSSSTVNDELDECRDTLKWPPWKEATCLRVCVCVCVCVCACVHVNSIIQAHQKQFAQISRHTIPHILAMPLNSSLKTDYQWKEPTAKLHNKHGLLTTK